MSRVSKMEGLARTVADPTTATAVEAMGTAHDSRDWEKVVAVGDAWIQARGNIEAGCATWYANALMGVRRYEDAVLWAQRSAKAMPRTEPVACLAAWATYAQALCRIGHFERAKTACLTCLAIDPKGHPESLEKQGHILATIALTAKKPVNVHGKLVQPERLWAKAWALMEHRLAEPERQLPKGFRWWDGLTKEPVAVLHEQGLGDAVLTARWLSSLAETTGHPVTYYGPATLHGWMREIPGVVVADLQDAQVRADAGEDLGAAIRCMSLAHLAHMRSPQDIPAPFAPAVLKTSRLYRDRSLIRVGVCWKGASIGWHDSERSYTPDQFAPVWLPLEGVEFVNLAHEADVPEDAPFARREFEDVMHTGLVMAGLDVVVTVDTGVAHLAGSLGIPTIVIPPTVTDWRWVWPRGTETPFYPNVTVVRRRRAEDTSVIPMARRLVEGFVNALKQRVA